MRAHLLVASLLLTACNTPAVLRSLEQESPPPELGRPGWVRASAKVGAIAGAGVGILASIVLLPVTYPLSKLADEPLGYAGDELLFAPVTWGASGGHFLLGAPADGLHYAFYRGWTEHPRPTGYDFTPLEAPVGPGAAIGSAPTSQPTQGQQGQR